MTAFHRLVPALLASGLLTAAAFAQTSPMDRPFPAPLQQMPAKSPALPPAEAVQTFYMPPGYYLELVAAEPLVRDPIFIEWDTHGRIWVVEMPSYLRNLDLPEPNLDPMCRVVVLEDTDHDGKMDKRTVFADGLIVPRSLKVLETGVLVAEPPNVWLMKDTNGDLKMDTKELVTDRYGRRDAAIEGNSNSFFWGLDNSMHTAGGDIFLRFKNGKIEVQKTLPRGEWGVTQDDAGRIYRNTNESALHVDFVPTPYYARNPNLLRTRGSYDALGRFDDANLVWPVRPTPGTNRAYQEGIARPDGTLARFSSACAPTVYRGDRLPAELYGSVFIAEPAANLMGRLTVTDTGKTLDARKSYPKGEFLASTDERFRPVFMSNAPDGTLYVVDMYRGIIQQRISITQHLHNEITKRNLDQDIERGRIYRVMHLTTKRDETPALAGFTPEQLVATLSHPNGWRRDRAQQILVERGDKSVVPALTRLAATADDPRTRLHALWTLDGLDAIDLKSVTQALNDSSRDVRVSAIRLAERWLPDPASPIQAEVLKRLSDPDWWVREQLAASLGTLPAGPRESAIARVLEYAQDPIVVDAAMSSVRGAETVVLEQLLKQPESVATESAITMLAATILRGAQDASAQRVLGWIADESKPAWQRPALMKGAEVALLGATMPGTVVVERPKLGARGGPAGSYKFEDNAASRAGAGGRGGGPRSSLRLNKEPAAFAVLTAEGNTWHTRATAVLARIEWPGKPGSTPVTPLTADQQQRFDRGREIFQNICQACHQPDGRGMDKVAPSLVDSALALAPAEVTSRILLNGKEGSVGLMPPLGMTLTDEQVASVLTYVRREWGQTGAPVEPTTVAQVRGAVGVRPRPWTNDELYALPEAAPLKQTSGKKR